VKYFVGLLALVALTAGATYGAYQAWDRATHTHDDNGGVLAGGESSSTPTSTTGPLPAQGQVAVTGTLSTRHLEGLAVGLLSTPVTVTAADRGSGGATFTPVQVKGKTTSIDWQTGQPLPITGGDGGGLKLGQVVMEVGGGAIKLVLDGVHGFVPGTYGLNSSVAVGSQPLDSVTFGATDATTVEFRGGITTQLPAVLGSTGTGNVTLKGNLTVTHPDGTTTPADSIALDNGPYTITLTPTPDGNFAVTATLQGTTH
jgi:hypothetical protein